MSQSRRRTSGSRPPSGKVPPRPADGRRRPRRSRRNWTAIGAGLAATLAGLVLVTLFIVRGGDDPTTPVPSTATATQIVADNSAVQSSPLATANPVDSAPTATAAPAIACADACFVRFAAPNVESENALVAGGLRPIYENGGWLWAAAPPSVIANLTTAQSDVTVIAHSVDTLPLYMIRLPPEQSDEDFSFGTGQVIDRVDNQLILSIPDLVPRADVLTDAGIAIEKLLPPNPPLADPAALPTMVGPGIVSDSVSIDALTKTVSDMQAIGGDGGLGSRKYRSAGNAMAADYIARCMDEIGLSVHYEDFIAWDGTYAVNVVGDLPGSDPSKLYLVLGHFDSINKDDGPAPGADDNATGIAGMLEIARALSGYRLRYPVRFVAMTGEEEAMQGSNAFAEAAIKAGTKYTYAFNLDAIGWSGRDHELIVNGSDETAGLQDLISSINDVFGLGQTISNSESTSIKADDSVLRNAGIPTVLISRSLLGENPVHHTEGDVIDLVDFPGVQSAAELVLLTIAELQSR